VHDLKITVMDPRLVENDMRELRKALLNIPDPIAPHDRPGRCRVRLPERRLADPAGLLGDLVGKPESLEHLYGPTGDPVGLTMGERTVLLFDDPRGNFGKGRKLGGERQAGRPATDNQNIDFGGKTVRTGLGHTVL